MKVKTSITLRKEREKRELERINRDADALNKEALDVINFLDIE